MVSVRRLTGLFLLWLLIGRKADSLYLTLQFHTLQTSTHDEDKRTTLAEFISILVKEEDATDPRPLRTRR
jgi:hypothetical protein